MRDINSPPLFLFRWSELLSVFGQTLVPFLQKFRHRFDIWIGHRFCPSFDRRRKMLPIAVPSIQWMQGAKYFNWLWVQSISCHCRQQHNSLFLLCTFHLHLRKKELFWKFRVKTPIPVEHWTCYQIFEAVSWTNDPEKQNHSFSCTEPPSSNLESLFKDQYPQKFAFSGPQCAQNRDIYGMQLNYFLEQFKCY